MALAKISVFPFWKQNPYLNLLLLEVRARGWQVGGGNTVDHLWEDIERLSAGDVFHLQWTSPFQLGVSNEAEFEDRLDRFVDGMEQLRSKGVRILWTIHNLVAHDAKYLSCEIRLAREMVRLSDQILILNSHTAQAAADIYELPSAKLVHLEHPSYLGVYGETIPPSSARAELGISEDRVLGFIGAIRPYKGVGEFLAAVTQLGRRHPGVAALLAGSVSESVRAEIGSQLPTPVPLYLEDRFLDDAEIATWVAACSVMALPYQAILNSGSMHLAATYGVPVVLPDFPHLVAEYGSQRWVGFFSAAGDENQRGVSLRLAMEEALEDLKARRQAAYEFARTNTPYAMAVRYAELLGSAASPNAD